MSFAYQPKTEEEIEKEEAENSLFPPGTYGFEVIEFAKFGDTTTIFTKDTQSSKGNDMMQIALRVYDQEGKSRTLVDYLLDAMSRKLRNSAYACGLGPEYEAGTLCAEKYLGKQGNLELVIQKGKKKDDGSDDFYPDRNSVKDYVILDGVEPLNSGTLAKEAIETQEMEDEIPF